MNPESLSNLVVAVASVIMAGAGFGVAWSAFRARRSRSETRMERRLAEMSQQLRAVTDRMQSPAGTIRHRELYGEAGWDSRKIKSDLAPFQLQPSLERFTRL
jgi:hypothetical protein